MVVPTSVEQQPDAINEKEAKKNVRTFAAASFFNDMGSDMIYPIWPLFLTEVLGANMAILGLVDGLGDALVSISQAVSGYISDRIRRRKVFVWIGYFFGGISRVGYALAGTWQRIIPFRGLDRAGKLRGAPRDAMIADESTQANRGSRFGLLRTMDNLGSVLGVLFTIAFLGLLGYRKIFWLAAIPSIIAVILVMFIIKERKAPESKIFKGFSLKFLQRDFKLFLSLNAVFALGAFSYSFLLILAKNHGYRDVTIPILYLVFSAVASLFSLPFGKLADKIGRKKVMLVAFLLWVVVCLGAIFFTSIWIIPVIFVLYGLHRGALEPVQKTLASELAPVDYRASSLGAFQLITGFAALPASLGAGLLWVRFGDTIPFVVSLGLTVVAGLLLLFIRENNKLIIKE